MQLCWADDGACNADSCPILRFKAQAPRCHGKEWHFPQAIITIVSGIVIIAATVLARVILEILGSDDLGVQGLFWQIFRKLIR